MFTPSGPDLRVCRLGRFRRDEDGSFVVFTLYLFIMMLMIGGLAVDMMRYEVTRARLQGTLDRAVLAATDLDQDLDPQAVVQDYFRISEMEQFLNAPSVVTGGVNFRAVDANASATVPMMFANMIGIREMPVVVQTSAIEKVENLEISLVLDISGSMRDNNRMNRLRPAATDFVNTIFLASSANTVTMNLVPYAGATNPSMAVFNHLAGVPVPAGGGTAGCLELNAGDFTGLAIPGNGRPQVPNFMNWNIAATVMDWGWCPTEAASMIWGSDNRTAINQRINSMRMHDGTGTHFAMKWAVAALSPQSAPIFNHLSSQGLIASTYTDRPLPFNSPDSRKIIVLMTDGQITEQVRPVNLSDPLNHTTELQKRPSSHRVQISSASTNINSFFAQCNLAKANGIIIYTIAFEAPSAAITQMSQCASSPSHFYRVDGLEIQDAFRSIASEIERLRLIL